MVVFVQITVGSALQIGVFYFLNYKANLLDYNSITKPIYYEEVFTIMLLICDCVQFMGAGSSDNG